MRNGSQDKEREFAWSFYKENVYSVVSLCVCVYQNVRSGPVMHYSWALILLCVAAVPARLRAPHISRHVLPKTAVHVCGFHFAE